MRAGEERTGEEGRGEKRRGEKRRGEERRMEKWRRGGERRGEEAGEAEAGGEALERVHRKARARAPTRIPRRRMGGSQSCDVAARPRSGEKPFCTARLNGGDDRVRSPTDLVVHVGRVLWTGRPHVRWRAGGGASEGIIERGCWPRANISDAVVVLLVEVELLTWRRRWWRPVVRWVRRRGGTCVAAAWMWRHRRQRLMQRLRSTAVDGAAPSIYICCRREVL